MMKNAKPGSCLVSVLLALLGCWLLVNGAVSVYVIMNVSQKNRSCTQEVEGIVSAVETTTHEKTGNDGTERYTIITATYTYEVGGINYTGQSSVQSRDRVEQGKKITVYYAPDDPSVSITEYNNNGSGYSIFVVALVFLLPGAACVAASIGISRLNARGAIRFYSNKEEMMADKRNASLIDTNDDRW